MSAGIISLRRVTKRYRPGDRNVIEQLDLDVYPGEFVSIMGPSGMGKTTLLNLIAGLDEPTSGVVMFDGTDLGQLADHQRADLRLRAIGFIFQNFNLIPSLTVEANVSLPLHFSGYSSAEIRHRAAEVLEQVELSPSERGRYPGELSGGEQQRVAIARALGPRPRVLLADEPTGNLDSETGAKILDLLQERRRSERMTVVMVTHNFFAASYGDRTIEFSDGRIVREAHVPSPQLVALRPGD